jgi:hypothetical protein
VYHIRRGIHVCELSLLSIRFCTFFSEKERFVDCNGLKPNSGSGASKNPKIGIRTPQDPHVSSRGDSPRVGPFYFPRPDARLIRDLIVIKISLSLSLTLAADKLHSEGHPKVTVMLNWISSPQCWCKNAWHSASAIRSACSRVWPCPRASQICHRQPAES